MYYVFTLDSVFKLVLPKGSEPTWQTSMLYIVFLIDVNETIYWSGNLPFFKIHVSRPMARDDSPGASVLSVHVAVRGLEPLSEFWDISFLWLTASWLGM